MDDAGIAFRLAADTGPRAGQGLAPAFRYGLTAFIAMDRALADRQPRPRIVHRIRDRVVDLILDSAVARLSTSHVATPCSDKTSTNDLGIGGERFKSVAEQWALQSVFPASKESQYA